MPDDPKRFGEVLALLRDVPADRAVGAHFHLASDVLGPARWLDGPEGVVEIKTMMPGKVVRLLKVKGDTVEKGEAVLVVEAMKMQNDLKAPKAGVVREIRVEEGSTVSAGDVLAVIE